MTAVLSRGSKMCSFIELRAMKLVYKRYASLYFCCAIGRDLGILFNAESKASPEGPETFLRHFPLKNKYVFWR